MKWIVESEEKPTKNAKPVVPYEEQEDEKLIYKLKKISSELSVRGYSDSFNENALKHNIEVTGNDEMFSVTVYRD